MACGALAMQAAGIEIDKYIAYEVDKYAIRTAQHNFPFIEERGYVFKADFTEYAGFDYLIGGRPRHYFAGVTKYETVLQILLVLRGRNGLCKRVMVWFETKRNE